MKQRFYIGQKVGFRNHDLADVKSNFGEVTTVSKVSGITQIHVRFTRAVRDAGFERWFTGAGARKSLVPIRKQA